MMLNKEYEFEGGHVTPLKPDVFLVTFVGEGKITRETVQKAHKCKMDLAGSSLHASIIDCRSGLSKFTAESKAMILSNIDPFDKNFVTILLVNSSFQKMEANIFIKLHPSTDNIVIVKNSKEAMEVANKEKLAAKSLNIAG